MSSISRVLASSEGPAVDDSRVPDITAHTPDANVNDQVSQSSPNDPDQAAPGSGDFGAPEITAANSIQTDAQARRDSDATLANLFGRMDLGSGPRFSAMTLPLTPEIYVQGPFSDPVQRASFALRVSEGLQNDQHSGDAADNLLTPPATSQFAALTRLQGMPHTPSPPRYDGSTALVKKKFIQQYQEYWFQCACIADTRRNRIAKYDLREWAESTSEEEWITISVKATKTIWAALILSELTNK
ncbi:hypothetical protein H310_13021 [Aphanomyces invadans]|uniref:Uncharacterized protein n=1 Tax=Aphanomyces invadans TaxID=157072 RepID=A0A024TFI8_9STRA|nr:hypothetical protein H310_13021 [Aphanomyces invadans]ETV92808.1 hypothetical protein H310_13021 [Aphanomyces invadans]|eukprot:XP_008878578.1 hypothetical protein H310_13021 [Aphanomyces invadans]